MVKKVTFRTYSPRASSTTLILSSHKTSALLHSVIASLLFAFIVVGAGWLVASAVARVRGAAKQATRAAAIASRLLQPPPKHQEYAYMDALLIKMEIVQL